MRLTAAGVFAAAAVLVVVAAVITGLYLVGPPSRVRAQRLDAERLQGLQSLRNAVELYQAQSGVLPETLDAAFQQSPYMTPAAVRDPDTDRPYEYRKTSAASYELCAQFTLASGEDEAMAWRHAPGRSCFAFKVKPPTASHP